MDPYAQRHGWEDTRLDLVDNDYVIIIHVEDYLHFHGLVEANTSSTDLIHFKRLQDGPQAAVDDDEDETPPPDIDDEHVHLTRGGLIALKLPRFIHEKRRGEHPECARGFVFGCASSLDVRLDPKLLQLGNGISRKHFAIGLTKGMWALRNLALPTATMFRGKPFSEQCAGTVFLDPDRKNTVVVRTQRGNLVLGIYCRHPGLATGSPLLESLPAVPPTDGHGQRGRSAHTTTVTAPPPTARPGIGTPARGIQKEAIIYYRPFRTVGRSGIARVFALNSLTGDNYIAKIYDRSQMSALKRRLRLLSPIRESTAFLSDHDLAFGEEAGSIYLLSPKREGIDVISKWVNEDDEMEQVARFLLWGLLAIVRQLHQAGIAHLDICQDTVFFGQACGNLFLGGFSEAKPLTPSLARKDCYQVFDTVKAFLGDYVPKLPSSWLNHDELDDLWRKLDDGPEPWTTSVIDICDAIGNDGDGLVTSCTSVEVTQSITIRHETRDGKKLFNRDDVRQFMTVRSRAWKVHDSAKGTFAALERYGDDDKYMSAEDISRAEDHIFKRHRSVIFLAPDVSRHQSVSSNRPLITSVSMGVPCYSRHGLISLSKMMLLVPGGFDAEGIRQRLKTHYELRGYEGGIYIAVEDFAEIANELGLKYDPRELPTRTDPSLLDCTSEDFFLVAANESARVCAVDRRKSLVMAQSGPVPLSTFLEQTMPSIESLEAYTLEEALSSRDRAEPPSCGYSCTSVFSSNDPTRFKFGISNHIGAEVGGPWTERWVQHMSATKRRL